MNKALEALEELRDNYESGAHLFDYKYLDIIEETLKVLEIIKDHKLLNYVLKNKKCANMYHLTEREIDLLKEVML